MRVDGISFLYRMKWMHEEHLKVLIVRPTGQQRTYLQSSGLVLKPTRLSCLPLATIQIKGMCQTCKQGTFLEVNESSSQGRWLLLVSPET